MTSDPGDQNVIEDHTKDKVPRLHDIEHAEVASERQSDVQPPEAPYEVQEPFTPKLPPIGDSQAHTVKLIDGAYLECASIVRPFIMPASAMG